jgi:D-glycero-beta-D-manno-heptose 1-phosphate adenylyltransferase
VIGLGKMQNITRARLIDEWVIAIIKQYEIVVNEPLSLAIPVMEIAEKLFHLRVDLEYFRGRLANTFGIIMPDKRWIILNQQQSDTRLRFTLAHELGHWCIDAENVASRNHTDAYSFPIAGKKPNEREQLANYFAGAILMPKPTLLGEVSKYRKVDYPELLDLSRAFQVSPSAMRIRLDGLQSELRDLGVQICLSDTSEPVESRPPAVTRPNWKYTIVKLDFSIVDHNLYRRLKSLRSESSSLYVLWTEKTTEDVNTVLEFDCVDGFIIANSLSQNEFDSNLIFGEGIRFVNLRNGLWLQHLEAESSRDLPVKAIVLYPRSSDGRLLHEQQELLDVDRVIDSSAELHYRGSAKAFIKSAKDEGKRVVIVTGCFDLVTNAHIRFLKRAKAAGDVLVVGMEDDVRVKSFKGAYRPVNTISQRVELMDALEFVDFTFVIKGSPKQNIKSFYTRLHRTLRADILAVSEGDPNLNDRQEEIEAAGGHLLAVSRMEEGSSTSLIRRVLAETEFSDLVYVSKKSLRTHIKENQNSWRQLALPMTP